MEYAIICGVLLFLVLLSTLYTKLHLSRKCRMIVDICIFLAMLVTTIAFGAPKNLLWVGLLFLLWVILGNVIGHFAPKFFAWMENRYLKKQGIAPNQKENIEETGNDFICKLLYYTLEFGWIAVFIWAVVSNKIS